MVGDRGPEWMRTAVAQVWAFPENQVEAPFMFIGGKFQNKFLVLKGWAVHKG